MQPDSALPLGLAAPLSPALASRYAWIGDAVLLLYSRRRILAEQGRIDDARCVRMTSNQFLASIAEPTRVEAEIGRIYEAGGYDSAVTWIEQNLMPVFLKQEENRTRGKSNPAVRK